MHKLTPYTQTCKTDPHIQKINHVQKNVNKERQNTKTHAQINPYTTQRTHIKHTYTKNENLLQNKNQCTKTNTKTKI